MQKQKANSGLVLGYGTGGLSQGLFTLPSAAIVLFFGVSVLSLYASIVAVIVATGFMVSILLDPLFSKMLSRTKNKVLGRRHGAMTLAILLAAGFNVGIYNLVNLPLYARALYLAFTFLSLHAAFSYFSVSFHALGEELAVAKIDNKRFTLTAKALLHIGMLAQTLLILLLKAGDINEYRNIALISSCGILFFGLLCVVTTYSQIPRLNKTPSPEPPASLITLTKSLKSGNRGITLGYLATISSAAMFMGLGLFYTRSVLGYEFWMVAIILSLFMVAVCAGYFIIKKPSKGRLATGLAFQLLGGAALVLAFTLNMVLDFNLFGGLIASSVGLGFGTGRVIYSASGMINKHSKNLPSLLNRLAAAITAFIIAAVWDISSAVGIVGVGYSFTCGILVLLTLSIGGYTHYFKNEAKTQLSALKNH